MGNNVGELSKTHGADGSGKLEHQLSALLEVLAQIYGADKLVLKAG